VRQLPDPLENPLSGSDLQLSMAARSSMSSAYCLCSGACDVDAEEVVEGAEILGGELTGEPSDDAL
jgi:hypothetical protein